MEVWCEVVVTLNVAPFFQSVSLFKHNPQAHWCIYNLSQKDTFTSSLEWNQHRSNAWVVV